MKSLKKKNDERKLLQQQYLARIDAVRKEYNEKSETIRQEMVKREEDRGRQWMESEKETLHVLNGVSSLLELSDKVDKNEFKKLGVALESIEKKIDDGKKLISKIEENNE